MNSNKEKIKAINDKVYIDVKNRYKKFYLQALKAHIETAEIPLKIEEIAKDKIRFELYSNDDQVQCYKKIKTFSKTTGQWYKKVIVGSLVSVIEFGTKTFKFSQCKVFEDKTIVWLKKQVVHDYDLRGQLSPEKLAKIFC